MFRFILAVAPLLLLASAAPRPQVFDHISKKQKQMLLFFFQSHAEALAAHQAAENAVRAAAGQVRPFLFWL